MNDLKTYAIGPRSYKQRHFFGFDVSFKNSLLLAVSLAMASNAVTATAAQVDQPDQPQTASQKVTHGQAWGDLEWMLQAAGLQPNQVSLLVDQPDTTGPLRGDTSPTHISMTADGHYLLHTSPMEMAMARSGDIAAQYTLLHELGHAVQHQQQGRTMVAAGVIDQADASALNDLFSANQLYGRTVLEPRAVANGEGEAYADAFAAATLIKKYDKSPAVLLALRSEAVNRFEHGGSTVLSQSSYHGLGYYALNRAIGDNQVVIDPITTAARWASEGVSDYALDQGRAVTGIHEITEDLVAAREQTLVDAAFKASGSDQQVQYIALEIAGTSAEEAYIKEAMHGPVSQQTKDNFEREASARYDQTAHQLMLLNAKIQKIGEDKAIQSEPAPTVKPSLKF